MVSSVPSWISEEPSTLEPPRLTSRRTLEHASSLLLTALLTIPGSLTAVLLAQPKQP